MVESTRTPETTGEQLSDIGVIMKERAERLHDDAERTIHDDERRQQFLTDFATACNERVRPAMEAVIARLRAGGGGGEIDEGNGGSAHPTDPRLTAWMSLDGEIVGHPRPDRNPYLQLDGESSDQVIQVSEGNMWNGKGSHSGRVDAWQLSEMTGEVVTAHLVDILRQAAS